MDRESARYYVESRNNYSAYSGVNNCLDGFTGAWVVSRNNYSAYSGVNSLLWLWVGKYNITLFTLKAP